jgi:hypothetical protein
MLEQEQAPTIRGLRASEAVSRALKARIARHGEAAVVEFIGLSRPTIARLFGGMPVQRATLMIAAQRLGVDLVGTLAEPDASDIADEDACG